MAELTRHNPPCNDPDCMPCWWDALDEESYRPPVTEDDGPPCWDLAPGGGARCGLDVDHEGEHRYTIWTPPKAD